MFKILFLSYQDIFPTFIYLAFLKFLTSLFEIISIKINTGIIQAEFNISSEIGSCKVTLNEKQKLEKISHCVEKHYYFNHLENMY